MNATIDRFESGWIALSISIDTDEVDALISRLQELKAGASAHFHIRNNDFDGVPGVADIELSMTGDGPRGSMVLE